jgi:hypothetical protein
MEIYKLFCLMQESLHWHLYLHCCDSAILAPAHAGCLWFQWPGGGHHLHSGDRPTCPCPALPSKGFALPLGDGLHAVTPGYTGDLSCVDPVTNASTCDNFAYPAGDKAVHPHGMTDVDAYAPFPNALLMNWATLLVLSFGNLCALDFQVGALMSPEAIGASPKLLKELQPVLEGTFLPLPVVAGRICCCSPHCFLVWQKPGMAKAKRSSDMDGALSGAAVLPDAVAGGKWGVGTKRCVM